MSLYKLAPAAGALLAAGLAPDESQSRVIRTVTPVEIDAPLTNPYMGWGARYDLEPRENGYDWKNWMAS